MRMLWLAVALLVVVGACAPSEAVTRVQVETIAADAAVNEWDTIVGQLDERVTALERQKPDDHGKTLDALTARLEALETALYGSSAIAGGSTSAPGFNEVGTMRTQLATLKECVAALYNGTTITPAFRSKCQ